MNELFPTREELLVELRDEVTEVARTGGGTCPACDQHVQQYRRTINKGMVAGLLKLYRAAGTHRFVHLPTVVGRKSSEESKLAYWNLIAEERVERPDGGRAGHWGVTQRGHHFLVGTLTVPKFAVVYNGQLLRLEGDPVSVQDCWRAPFDLYQLLKDSQ